MQGTSCCDAAVTADGLIFGGGDWLSLIRESDHSLRWWAVLDSNRQCPVRCEHNALPAELTAAPHKSTSNQLLIELTFSVELCKSRDVDSLL